jgi:hypothetical protein
MGESSSLQDRSVLEVSGRTIAATLWAFTGTKELQDSPYTQRAACRSEIQALPGSKLGADRRSMYPQETCSDFVTTNPTGKQPGP